MIQLLSPTITRCYTETEGDWEEFLPLVLYAYRTAIHSSTHVSPFQLMFGRSLAVTPFQCPYKFDTTNYASRLKAKLQAMQTFVRTNLTKCAEQQKKTMRLSHVAPFLQRRQPCMGIDTNSKIITATLGWKMDCQ